MSATPLTNDFAVTSPGPTAGTLLRQAREAAGLHIGALAVSLKVPVKKIEALEADRVDLLPDAVFARALASSICRTLKIDAGPILSHLPQGLFPKLKTDESSLNAAYQSSSVGPSVSIAQKLSKPFVLIGLALVAAAAVLLIAPGTDTFAPAKMTDMTVLPQANLAPAADIGAAGATATSEVALRPAPPADAAALEKREAGTAAALTADTNNVVSGTATGPASQEGLVVFAAKAVSWVEVIDSAGVVQLRKTLAAGETASASGQTPLKVVVGRVDAINAKVRGKDFDLGAVSRDNVARFEVR